MCTGIMLQPLAARAYTDILSRQFPAGTFEAHTGPFLFANPRNGPRKFTERVAVAFPFALLFSSKQFYEPLCADALFSAVKCSCRGCTCIHACREMRNVTGTHTDYLQPPKNATPCNVRIFYQQEKTIKIHDFESRCINFNWNILYKEN